MNAESFDDVVSRIYEADYRFDPDAYFYLREVLDRTSHDLGRDGPKAENRHLTGAELSAGFRDCLLDDVGPLAATVADEWGVGTTDDIGAMVYNLIEAGAFGKSASDRREDFRGLFDLAAELEAPYLPDSEKPSPAPAKKRARSASPHPRKDTP